MDVKKYLGKIERLSKILEKVAISKKSFYFDNETLKQNKSIMNFDTLFNSMKNERFCDHVYNLCGYSDPSINFERYSDVRKAFSEHSGLSADSEFCKTKKDTVHCVVLVNSQSKLTIYCFEGNIEEKIKGLLPKTLDLVFKVENSDSDILAVSNSFSVFPASLWVQRCSMKEDSTVSYDFVNLFTPRFSIASTGQSTGGLDDFLYIYDQILDLSDEELLNTKQLSAAYEITNDRE